MNSMIRQHHLRISDIKAYLRTFDRHKPLSPDEWAVQESNLYDPGYLVFCLESVAPPAGLSTFSKRGEEQGETFRVKDMCVVVSKDDGKCVAVIISPSAYEFRVLDTLLLEKAMRAILDGRDFHYLAARPVQKMDGETVKALYKLGSNYAKGGSRRTLTAEGAALQEPAIALLGQLGAKLGAQVNKQLLDIGSVCHMIFTPEGRQEDKSKAIIKATFVPVRADDLTGGAASAPQTLAGASEGQPLYSIDPMQGAANLADNYSTEAGNIDLSALAPQPEANAFETPAGAFMDGGNALGSLIPDNSQAQPAQPSEPTSSFGDFGMGLLSALAPDQIGQPSQPSNFDQKTDTGLPSASAMAANIDTLPPSGPTGTYAGLASAGISGMDNLDQPQFSSPSSSFTGLAGMPEMPMMPPAQPAAPAQAPMQAQALDAPSPFAPPQIFNAQSATIRPAVPGMPGAPGAPNIPFPPTASQVNIPAVRPVPVNQARSAAAPWYILSHDATPVSASAPAMDVTAAVEAAAQAQSAAAAAQAAQPAPAVVPEPREDFSNQFLNDMQSGLAGPAAIEAAEKEAAEEARLNRENAEGKEQRLKEYFGDEHFNKYVKGDSVAPGQKQGDSWQLDPNQYKSEAASGGPDFDSDIFANAGRSTLETNPDATFVAPPKEEITGPPPDPSWAIPTAPAAPTPSAFDSMLSAGAEGTATAAAESNEVPSLGILDALNEGLGASPAAASAADSAPSSFAPDTASGDTDSASLFARLTGELSKEPAQPHAADLSAQPQVDASPVVGSVSEPAPTTVNWKPNAVESGASWPSISPNESLFSQPDEDLSLTLGALSAAADIPELTEVPVAEEAKAPAADAPAVLPPAEPGPLSASEFQPPSAEAPLASNQSMVAPGQTSETEVKSETFAPVEDAPEADAQAAETQQPRVRPRDYSSPLRAPRALNAADRHTPTTPHQTLKPNSPSIPNLPVVSSASLAANESAVSAEAARSPELNPLPTVAEAPAPAALEADLVVARPAVEAIAEPVAEPVVEPVVEQTVEPVVADTAPAAPPAPSSFTRQPTTPQPALSSSSSSSPLGAGAPAGAQDTRLMMNEMTSLMSKLELQVAKAANKIASRGDELRTRLSHQVDSLVKEAQDVEKVAEGNLIALASEFKAKLDNLALEVQTNLSKEGISAQDTMEALAQTSWDKLEQEQKALTDEIKRSGDHFRLDLDKLTASVSHRLDTLIENRNQELASLSDQILSQLKESNDAYNVKVAQRYERFEVRTNEETASITSSLERNMRSMVEEIESSLERACEKLKNTRFELEQTVAHTIAVSEMAIAQKAKLLLTETLLPRLNEQKEIIRTMISDMTKQIVNESTSSLDAEVAKLHQGTSHAGDALRQVADECVAEVEMTGRGIKTGLEESFKRASSDLMVRTREVGDKIRETERRMADSEYALKGLAEASTVDSEPELADERNHAVAKLATLKQEASQEMSKAIEANIEHLDSESERLFSELSNNRAELTTQIRESAEANISTIRQALQDATNAILAAREKHME